MFHNRSRSKTHFTDTHTTRRDLTLSSESKENTLINATKHTPRQRSDAIHNPPFGPGSQATKALPSAEETIPGAPLRRSNIGNSVTSDLNPPDFLCTPDYRLKGKDSASYQPESPVTRQASVGAPTKCYSLDNQGSEEQEHTRAQTDDIALEASIDDGAMPESGFCSIQLFNIGTFKGIALLDPMKDYIFPTTAELQELQSLFKMEHTAEMGYGLVATQPIQAGETILVERPLVILPADLKKLKAASDLVTILAKIPTETRQEFMKLANCVPFECGKIEGIVRTNAIPIELMLQEPPGPDSAMYRGIFLTTSRCNHSCSPNAALRWNAHTLTLYLEAVRPLKSGEQITVHYVPLDQPRRERRAQLQSLYNFNCKCHRCNIADKDVRASDDHRQLLFEFKEQFPSFEEWCFDLAFPDDLLIRAHRRALDLITKEGLEGLGREKHLDIIAMCYGALGDHEQFTAWIEQVRDIRVKRRPEQSTAFEKWIADPRTFPIWEWRNRVRNGESPPQYDGAILAGLFSPPSWMLPQTSY